MVSWIVKASYGLTSVSGQATVITERVSSAGAVRDGCESPSGATPEDPGTTAQTGPESTVQNSAARKPAAEKRLTSRGFMMLPRGGRTLGFTLTPMQG